MESISLNPHFPRCNILAQNRNPTLHFSSTLDHNSLPPPSTQNCLRNHQEKNYHTKFTSARTKLWPENPNPYSQVASSPPTWNKGSLFLCFQLLSFSSDPSISAQTFVCYSPAQHRRSRQPIVTTAGCNNPCKSAASGGGIEFDVARLESVWIGKGGKGLKDEWSSGTFYHPFEVCWLQVPVLQI